MSIWVYVDDVMTEVKEIPPAGDDTINTKMKQLIKEGKIKADGDSTDAGGKTWRERPPLL